MLRHAPELLSQLHRTTGRYGPIAQVEVVEPVLIRYSRDGDWPALERLAALDSRSLAEGAFLLAEMEGELVAAAPLDLDEEPLSDPFRPTATLRELFRLRARQIRRSQARLSSATARPVLGEAT